MELVSGRRNFLPINAPGMGRFQLFNLGGLGYGLQLRFWVVIAILVSLTLTILNHNSNDYLTLNPKSNPKLRPLTLTLY